MHVAWLAQSVECGTLNPRVVGSSPTLGKRFACMIQHIEGKKRQCFVGAETKCK